MATSINVCGIPLGNLIAPIVIPILIQNFGWRGALMIQSGIMLHLLISTLLWQLPDSLKLTTEKKSLKTMVKNLFDFSVVRNPMFVGYLVAEAFIRFNTRVFFAQTTSRAVFYGYSLEISSILLTFLCLCSLISRTTLSIILRFHELNPMALASTVGFIQASMACLITLSTNYIWMMSCTALFGAAQGKL